MPQSIRKSGFKTLFVQRCAALLIAVLLLGCGKGTNDNSADAPDPSLAKEQIRAALPEAAGIPIDEFEPYWGDGKVPDSLPKVDNKPLSYVLMGFGRLIPDANVELLDSEIRQLDSTVDPGKLVRQMSASRDKGYASMIRPDSIDEFTCEVSGKSAQGQVTFTVKDWFQAKVNYVAKFDAGKWLITEFALPNWQVKTVRQDDGSWRASGEGFFPTLKVYLPAVKGLPPREDSSNRMVILIGYPPELKGPTIDDLGFAVSGRRATETEFGDLLSTASRELAEERKIRLQQMVVVIRPSFDAPARLIQKLIAQLQAEQFSQIRLAGLIREDVDKRTRYRMAPGEVAISMLDPQESVESKDKFIQVRLMPGKEGELGLVSLSLPGLDEIECKDELAMQQCLIEHLGDGEPTWDVVFEVDDQLAYRPLLKALSAASGYYDDKGQRIPLAAGLRLLSSPPASR